MLFKKKKKNNLYALTTSNENSFESTFSTVLSKKSLNYPQFLKKLSSYFLKKIANVFCKIFKYFSEY